MITLAEKLASTLREKIRQGEYALGDRLPAERSMEKLFSVSRRTIRGALDILQQEKLIIRKQGWGSFVADPAHISSGGASNLIAIMVREREYYFEPVVTAASSRASNKGYTLATGSNLTPELESQNIDAFISNGIRGVILWPRLKDGFENYKKLIDNGIEVVLIDAIFPNHYEDNVLVDDHYGMYLAAEHLAELGHKNIAYFGRSREELDYPTGFRRRHGFLDGCSQFGLKTKPEWIIKESDLYFNRENEAFLGRVTSILTQKDRPTAFVCYNDRWAIEIIGLANQLGFKVPQDLSVIGFDDSYLAKTNQLPLTSTHPEFEEMGITAVDMLIEKLHRDSPRPPRGILIRPNIVKRKSTDILYTDTPQTHSNEYSLIGEKSK